MLTLTLALHLALQDEPAPETEAPRRKSWERHWVFGGSFRYDSNVFLLSESERSRLDDDLAADATSRRFNDMDRPHDFVFTPRIGFRTEGESPLDRDEDLGLSADIELHKYFLNSEKYNIDFRFEGWHTVCDDGKFTLAVEFVPGFFHKNFLSAVTDAAGPVTADELRFSDATYDDVSFHAEYWHVLMPRDDGDFALDGWLEAGYRSRDYDTFDGRDQSAPSIGLGARVRHAEGYRLSLGYRFDASDSPTRREVMVRNEPTFATDFNLDGDAADLAVRTTQAVNRAFDAHTLHFKLEADLFDDVLLTFRYSHEWRGYDSAHAFDTDYRRRDDEIDAVSLAFTFPIVDDLTGDLLYEYTSCRSNLSSFSATGDDNEFTRHVASFGVTYGF